MDNTNEKNRQNEYVLHTRKYPDGYLMCRKGKLLSYHTKANENHSVHSKE